MVINKILILSVVLGLLTACGRRNLPEQLESNGYPHPYPAPVIETFDGGEITTKNSSPSESENSGLPIPTLEQPFMRMELDPLNVNHLSAQRY